jgi:hypothetical protein
MNLQKITSRFGLLLFITIVSSCAQQLNNTPLPSPVISTTPIIATIATRTATLTLTPSPTSTPFPTTPTDVPTLPVEDARQHLLAILENNNDCRLPCLWGITPGRSNYLDARSVLIPFSSLSDAVVFDWSYPGGGISPQYIEDSYRLNTSISYLYGENDIVYRMRFRILEEELSQDEYGNQLTTPIYGSPEFIRRTEYYSLSHLMSEQGVPASVMISTEFTFESNRKSFLIYIVVLYPNRGIWAKYTTWVDKNGVGSNFKTCPVNARIEMELYPSGNPDSFYTLLDETNWGITKAGYKTLEEATSMSVEEFYQTFRQPNDKCIETPSGLWPTPER